MWLLGLRLLPLSRGKGHVVLCVQQMPRRRLEADELEMSVTWVKQAKPHNAHVWQDDGRRQLLLLSPLLKAVNIQRSSLKAKVIIQISPGEIFITDGGAWTQCDPTLRGWKARGSLIMILRINLMLEWFQWQLYNLTCRCQPLWVLSSDTCSHLHAPTDLRPQPFLPDKKYQWWCVRHGVEHAKGALHSTPFPLPTLQNHLDHREWVNHIRGPEERWEVDSTVTAGVALARLIPLGRGKRGTPSRLQGWEREKHFPRNEFTCMVTQRSWPVDAY